MDLFRYFQPHHNPRLRAVPLRLQELGELEQAAEELKRAIKRSKWRSEAAPVGDITGEHFEDLLSALDYIIDELRAMGEAHPGDELEDILNLADERKNIPGWESWVNVVRHRLRLLSPV